MTFFNRKWLCGLAVVALAGVANGAQVDYYEVNYANNTLRIYTNDGKNHGLTLRNDKTTEYIMAMFMAYGQNVCIQVDGFKTYGTENYPKFQYHSVTNNTICKICFYNDGTGEKIEFDDGSVKTIYLAKYEGQPIKLARLDFFIGRVLKIFGQDESAASLRFKTQNVVVTDGELISYSIYSAP